MDVKLCNDDCLNVLKDIEDNSIDCVISDIPYGIDFEEWDVTHNNTNSALLGQSPQNIDSDVFKKRGKPLNGWSQQDKERKVEFQRWCSQWLFELNRNFIGIELDKQYFDIATKRIC